MNKLIYICIFCSLIPSTYTLIEKDEQIKVNDLYQNKDFIRMKQDKLSFY